MIKTACCQVVGCQSTRHTVNSSHTRLVTQLTRHKRAHNKATSRNFYVHAGQVAPRNSAEHGRRTYGKRAISKSPTTAKLLKGMNARSTRRPASADRTARTANFRRDLDATQLSAHAQNHASPERCRKSFTMIFLGDNDIPLTGSNFGNLTAFRAISAIFSLRMRRNAHL